MGRVWVKGAGALPTRRRLCSGLPTEGFAPRAAEFAYGRGAENLGARRLTPSALAERAVNLDVPGFHPEGAVAGSPMTYPSMSRIASLGLSQRS